MLAIYVFLLMSRCSRSQFLRLVFTGWIILFVACWCRSVFTVINRPTCGVASIFSPLLFFCNRQCILFVFLCSFSYRLIWPWHFTWNSSTSAGISFFWVVNLQIRMVTTTLVVLVLVVSSGVACCSHPPQQDCFSKTNTK